MTKFRHGLIAVAAGAVAAGLFTLAEIGSHGEAVAQQATDPATLKPAADFNSIQDKNERAIALFREAGKVLQSPRCLNCHPAGGAPDPDRKHVTASAFGGSRRCWHWRARAILRDVSSRSQLRSSRRSRQSEMVARACRDGLAGQDARADVRSDQRPGSQRRQGHGRSNQAHGGR